MSDLIDRAEAISRAVELRMYGKPVKMVEVSALESLPSVRAEHGENSPSEQPQMNELGVNTGETCTDTISRQALIDKLIKLGDYYNARDEVKRGIHQCIAATYELPSAQRTCVNCGRTVNNGGWYADGRTRCPIEEHYALPKDGYCHLWEKRNITDDDYPERRTDGRD